MRLPAAERIVALGPRDEVQFAGSNKPASVPLTEMLEFEVHDGDDVRLVQKCGSETKEYKALSCREMRDRYDEVFGETTDQGAPESQERSYIDFALRSCADNASYLFVGIGMDPRKKYTPGLIEAHGRDFFNNKILPEIFGGAANVPPGKKLVEKGYFNPKENKGAWSYGARVTQTSFEEENSLYVPVMMIENCTSPLGMVHQ